MRRHLWLAAAFLLFSLAALLATRADRKPERPASRVEVQFPHYMRPAERQRMTARQTLADLPIHRVMDADAGAAPDPRPRDPLLAALPRKGDSGVMVIEASALRHSQLGERLVACLQSREGDVFGKFRDKSGIDILEDVDRVAISEKGVVVSGFFAKAKWSDVFDGRTPEAYGGAKLYANGDGNKDRPSAAVWRNELLVIGDTDEDVRKVMDRVEGRAKPEPPLLGEYAAYGEIYGLLSKSALEQLFSNGNEELGKKVAALASRIELHVDASHDVGIVSNVFGDDSAGLSDLARSLGGALSLARLKARTDGDDLLAEFLDHARVDPQSKNVSLEVALPLSTLEAHLQKVCRPIAERQADARARLPEGR